MPGLDGLIGDPGEDAMPSPFIPGPPGEPGDPGPRGPTGIINQYKMICGFLIRYAKIFVRTHRNAGN